MGGGSKKVEKPDPPPNTPTRADPTVVTASIRETGASSASRQGYSAVTNNATGILAKSPRTGKKLRTGGT